jgi:hypothetical protein
MPMLYIILVVLGAWAVLATVVCVSVSMSAARFNREADQTPGISPAFERMPPDGQQSLAAQRSRS